MPTDEELLKDIDHDGFETDDDGNISSLSLFHKKIPDISFVGQLKHLRRLDVRGNNITDISPLMGLKKLTHLLLSYNQITTLPREVIDLDMEIKFQPDETYVEGINLFHNPLQHPPYEIIMKGKDAVKAYFESLDSKTKTPELHEIKLSLIGNNYSGKTSLARRLCGEEFDSGQTSTHGLHIHPWHFRDNGKEINVRLWDFGGHEIAHTTHHYFFSRRGIYLLVLDATDDEKYHCEYWLKHIESFSGEAPVLVVINKADTAPHFEINRSFLKRKYKNIKGFYRVSCKTGKGIDLLVDGLRTELAGHDILKTTWSSQWVKVKNRLESMDDYFISIKEYRKMCSAEGITDKSGQNTLLDFLNDLGIVLHFRHLPPAEALVLNARWGMSALYRIINSSQLIKQKGVLDVPVMYACLKPKDDNDFQYPPESYRCLIELIKECGLGYESERGKIIIPGLLEVEEPSYRFNFKSALHFVIQYDFMPRSLMPCFTVRMHPDIKEGLQWRSGVVLQSRSFQAEAVVKADHRDRRICVYVTGNQKQEYFPVLRNTLNAIASEFVNLNARETIPLPGHPDVSIFFEELTGHDMKGMEEIYVGRLRQSFNVKELLDNYLTAEQRKEEIKKNAMNRPEGGNIFLKISEEQAAVPSLVPALPEEPAESNTFTELEEEFQQLEALFFQLKDMLEETPIDDRLQKRLDAIEDGLDRVTMEMTGRELVFPLKKLGRLIAAMNRKESRYSEALRHCEGSAEIIRQMIGLYIQMAQELRLPEA